MTPIPAPTEPEPLLPTPSHTAATHAERLDALPFNRKHRKLLVGSGIGWALDAMDVGLVSFILAALISHWGITNSEGGWFVSVGFIGMAVGATLGGLLADRIGRKSVFALTLVIYGLATGASALAGGLAVLIALRFVIGLGLGAELPVASTLVSEFAPARIRGRVVVILEAFWAVGWIAAAMIGFFVVAPYDQGWRWGLAIGAIPAIYALVIRYSLPESVRFLLSRGRHDEAEQVVREFEAESGVPAPKEPSPLPPASAQRYRVRDLFAHNHRRRTIGLWGVWFGLNFAYYGAFTWLPSLLVAQGNSLTQSFQYTLIITLAQLPGYALAAWLIEAWGRKPTLITFLAGAALSALGFALAATNGAIPGVIAAGSSLSFFALGAWGAVYAVTPEMYPTAIRGTGTGWAAGFGRIASVLAPLSVPLLMGRGGMWLVFSVFTVAFAFAAVSATLLREASGESLEA